MSTATVTISRPKSTVELPATKATVELYTSITVKDQMDLLEKFSDLDSAIGKMKFGLETIARCLISWNIVGDDGKELPLTSASIGLLPQEDMLKLMGIVMQKELLDGQGRPLSAEEVAKKASGA